MISRPAISTPCPLPRKREHAKKRPAIALASANRTSMRFDSSGLTPAKAIQKDEAPLARRKSIQTNEALADAHQCRLAGPNARRIATRPLVIKISRAADVQLLELMVDETYRAAQNAPTFDGTAAISRNPAYEYHHNSLKRGITVSLLTRAYILEKYGPRMTLAQLAQLLLMSEGTIRNQINAETFPIPTYKEGSGRFAAYDAVADYLGSMAAQARRQAA